MKRECPKCNSRCPRSSSFGYFKRKFDGKKIQRYRCHHCLATYSDATYQSCYRQKKRRLNPKIRVLLCSNASQRRIARILKISRTTVARKHVFLAEQAKIENQKDFEKLPLITELQFDDLETIEHTKCKPLSVTVAVEKHSRKILGFDVCSMPAKGHLAKYARKKYGYRPDERHKARNSLFKELARKIATNAIIESDQSPHYPETVKRWCPDAQHITSPGKKGCVAGQGELKKVEFDPLFSINHTLAMLRANINRLIRKTWCTTKDPTRLKDHIEIYVLYHNRVLTA